MYSTFHFGRCSKVLNNQCVGPELRVRIVEGGGKWESKVSKGIGNEEGLGEDFGLDFQRVGGRMAEGPPENGETDVKRVFRVDVKQAAAH